MSVLKGRNKGVVSLRSLQDRISLVACDLGLRFACPRLLAMAPSAPCMSTVEPWLPWRLSPKCRVIDKPPEG